MILPAREIRLLLASKAREIRIPYTSPHLPEIEPDQVVPVLAAAGRAPVFWMQMGCQGSCVGRCEGRGWYPDDDAEEYVIEFRRVPEPDTPLLLMPAGRPKHSELGYTDKPYLAMRDEPEAVGSEWIEKFTKTAEGEHAKTIRARVKHARHEREALSVEQRMVKARLAARLNNVDVRNEIKALERMQANGRQQGQVVAQLARVEFVAYREAA